MTDGRTRETHVVIPLEQALVMGANAALLVAVGMLLVRRWGVSVYGWLDIALMVVGAFGLGFAGWWLFTMYVLRPERERPVEMRTAPMRMDVAMPVIRPAFSAHDALRFVHDALICVNGVWSDKDGGSSQREMERKGWPRAEWDMAVAWLLEHGILEWKNPQAHQQGTRWNYVALDRFVGRGL